MKTFEEAYCDRYLALEVGFLWLTTYNRHIGYIIEDFPVNLGFLVLRMRESFIDAGEFLNTRLGSCHSFIAYFELQCVFQRKLRHYFP